MAIEGIAPQRSAAFLKLLTAHRVVTNSACHYARYTVGAGAAPPPLMCAMATVQPLSSSDSWSLLKLGSYGCSYEPYLQSQDISGSKRGCACSGERDDRAG
jgi:hypothetical protein